MKIHPSSTHIELPGSFAIQNADTGQVIAFYMRLNLRELKRLVLAAQDNKNRRATRGPLEVRIKETK